MIATLTVGSGTPLWVILAATALSGAGGAMLTWLQARKLLPSQTRSYESQASHDAIQTVETALNVAKGRVDSLEAQVRENSRTIGQLQGRLVHEQNDRQRIGEQLNLALAERARLEQQIIDINRIIGQRRIQDLAEGTVVDAMVMVDLQGGIISYVNEGVFSLLGYMPNALVGQHLSVLIPEGLRDIHAQHRAGYAKDPRTRQMGSGLNLVARRVDGTTIPVDISLHPTGDGRVLALMRRRKPTDAPVSLPTPTVP